MGKRFTEEEIAILKQHPGVKSVNCYRLQLTPEFKTWFYMEYRSGKSTPRILKDAGFDLAMLGKRRIQSIRSHTAEWFENNGAPHTNKKDQSVPTDVYELAAANEKINRLERQLKHTKQELEFIKKIINAGYGESEK